MDDDIPYLLLTPGPLTTTRSVREAMLLDVSTWDVDYNTIVESVRSRLVALATGSGAGYTSVLMQGSGTFSIEAALGSAIPADGRLLLVSNGAYGVRMGQITAYLGIATHELRSGESEPVDLERVRAALEEDPGVTHVAMVHCETTTGMLNPAREVGALCAEFDKVYVLDAMSSFGGIPMSMQECGAHFLVSSANKCIQGVPGFGFVICEREKIEQCEGRGRSLSLDLFEQWRGMEQGAGKWRYTSPTHVLRAFARALDELELEGGVGARHARYRANQRTLVAGMRELGFRTLLPDELQSPIITAFHDPVDERYRWQSFYDELKRRRFVIYPGKVTDADTFRIANIGNVFPEDIEALLEAIRETLGSLDLSVA